MYNLNDELKSQAKDRKPTNSHKGMEQLQDFSSCNSQDMTIDDKFPVLNKRNSPLQWFRQSEWMRKH